MPPYFLEPARALFRASVLSSALLGGAMLTGCGGGSDSSETSSSSASSKSFSGTVSSYDGTTLTVDGIVVNTSNSSGVPTGVKAGTKVEIEGYLDGGVLYARLVKFDDDASDNYPDGVRNELEGTITAYVNASNFSVNGVPVDASGAVRIPSGLAVGAKVEIHGILVNGVMQADKIEVKSSSSSSDDRSDDHNGVDDHDGCDDDRDTTCDDSDPEDDRDERDDHDD